MDLENIVFNVLKNIYIDKVSLNHAFQTFIKKDFLCFKKDIIDFCLYEIKHHLLLEHVNSKTFKKENIENLIALDILLANKYHPFLNNDDLMKFVLEKVKKNKTEISKEKIDSFFLTLPETIYDLALTFQKDDELFLSLLYNVPRFIVHMWLKQYGKKIALQVLKAINVKPKIAFRQNEFISSSSRIEDDPDFQKSPIDKVYYYVGKNDVKNISYLIKEEIFPTNIAYKLIADKFKFNIDEPLAFYTHNRTNLFLELALKKEELTNFDIITNSPTYAQKMSDKIQQYHIKNTFVYYDNITSALAIVNKHAKAFFLIPQSSCLDYLRKEPDYFFRIEQKDLDQFIKNQLLSLEEAYHLIINHGEIIYLIPTLSKKESEKVIRQFLSNHHDLSLIYENQFLPLDELDACLYAAIIRKDHD